jgi:hypothetical protein
MTALSRDYSNSVGLVGGTITGLVWRSGWTKIYAP